MKAVAISIVACVNLCLASCGREPQQQSNQPAVSFAATEPGSHVQPTNDASFQLMGADPVERLATLQALVIHAGNRCSAVTRGVLEDGLDGTDEWSVNCADSGIWHVWFRPDSEPEVDR
jgi:hypothetical protein